jgi:hypothetical protein
MLWMYEWRLQVAGDALSPAIQLEQPNTVVCRRTWMHGAESPIVALAAETFMNEAQDLKLFELS